MPSLSCYARMQLIWADQGDRVILMNHECPVIPCLASMQQNICCTDAIEQLGPSQGSVETMLLLYRRCRRSMQERTEQAADRGRKCLDHCSSQRESAQL